MDIRNLIENSKQQKDMYEYLKSIGYGEKAASVLSLIPYGRSVTRRFMELFKGENILDRVYDELCEINAEDINAAMLKIISQKCGDNPDESEADSRRIYSRMLNSAPAGSATGMGGGLMGGAVMASSAMMGGAVMGSGGMMAQAMMSASAAPMGMPMNAFASMSMAPGAGFQPAATDSYERIEEKDEKSVITAPTSTFRMTTSTASVGILLNQVRSGRDFSISQVRIEELLNYFDYDNGRWEKENREKFRISTELLDKAEGRKILYINVEADDTPKPVQNIVLLLDTSGSMGSNSDNTIAAIATVVSKLNKGDTFSLVTYSTQDHTYFENHEIAGQGDKEDVMGVILGIEITGCTNGSAGIETAYSIGEKTYSPEKSNQVILITDGDLNFGIADKDGLKNLIEEKKKTGMFLSVIGTGLYNYKDDKLEVLSKYGNGTYCVVNNLDDVKESINRKYVSLTNIVAKDVKAQVEFNPKYVSKYRLLGYENRTLAHEDFVNDAVVSEPYGSGGQGVAVYELYMGDASASGEEQLKYQKLVINDLKELGTVKVRYKMPLEDVSEEVSAVIPVDCKEGENVKKAYLVYCLSERLRNSGKLDNDDYKYLAGMLNDDKYRELLKGKDDVFCALFEKLKNDAVKEPEKSQVQPIPQPFVGFPSSPFGMGMGMMTNGANSGPVGQSTTGQTSSNGNWVCSKCGTTNAGKFCAGCGNPRE